MYLYNNSAVSLLIWIPLRHSTRSINTPLFMKASDCDWNFQLIENLSWQWRGSMWYLSVRSNQETTQTVCTGLEVRREQAGWSNGVTALSCISRGLKLLKPQAQLCNLLSSSGSLIKIKSSPFFHSPRPPPPPLSFWSWEKQLLLECGGNLGVLSSSSSNSSSTPLL